MYDPPQRVGMDHPWLRARMLVASAVLGAFYLALIAGIVWVLRSGVLFGAVAKPWLAVTVGVVAVFGFVVAEWIGETRYVLNRVGATDVDEDEFPWIHERTEVLCERMNVPKPRLMVARLGDPNAFAVGRQGAGAVVLSTELLRLLEPEEIDGVIAHELSHLKSRDSIVMLLGHGVATMLGFVASAVFLTDAMERDRNLIVALFGTLVSGLVHVVVMSFVLVISRYREYVADHDAAVYTGNPEGIAGALERIATAHREGGASVTPEVSSLCIFGMERGILDRLLADHPPIEKRIDRLRGLSVPVEPRSDATDEGSRVEGASEA